MKNRQTGFTLLELAVVLTIVGLIAGVSLIMLRPMVDNARYTATQTKLQKISQALSAYAIKNNRLPCPASPNPTVEPFGFPRQSGADGIISTNLCGPGSGQPSWAEQSGIVPYQVLGLGESQVKDAYGNFITYAVTPVLTGYSEVASGGRVQEVCRTRTWIDTASGRNRNPAKARFCCPAYVNLGTQFKLTDNDGYDLLRSQYEYSGSAYVPNFYGDHNATYDNTPDTLGQADHLEDALLAFVVISHGKNGDGAYLKGTSSRHEITSGGSGGNEYPNYTPSATYRIDSYKTKRTDAFGTFDDIVVWRTNKEIMSEFGNKGCEGP